jgi:hypothetical protein
MIKDTISVPAEQISDVKFSQNYYLKWVLLGIGLVVDGGIAYLFIKYLRDANESM